MVSVIYVSKFAYVSKWDCSINFGLLHKLKIVLVETSPHVLILVYYQNPKRSILKPKPKWQVLSGVEGN